jgi:hypothetical protein
MRLESSAAICRQLFREVLLLGAKKLFARATKRSGRLDGVTDGRYFSPKTREGDRVSAESTWPKGRGSHKAQRPTGCTCNGEPTGSPPLTPVRAMRRVPGVHSYNTRQSQSVGGCRTPAARSDKRSGRPVSAAGRYFPPSEGSRQGRWMSRRRFTLKSRYLRRWPDTMSSKGAAADCRAKVSRPPLLTHVTVKHAAEQ